RLEVNDRAQAASDQALDLDRASVLLAGRCFTARALERRARQHAVFGGDPAARLALEPGRQAVFQRRRDQNMRVAKAHEAGAFRVFHDAPFERYGPQFIGLSAARPHAGSPWTLAFGARFGRWFWAFDLAQSFRGAKWQRQGRKRAEIHSPDP